MQPPHGNRFTLLHASFLRVGGDADRRYAVHREVQESFRKPWLRRRRSDQRSPVTRGEIRELSLAGGESPARDFFVGTSFHRGLL